MNVQHFIGALIPLFVAIFLLLLSAIPLKNGMIFLTSKSIFHFYRVLLNKISCSYVSESPKALGMNVKNKE